MSLESLVNQLKAQYEDISRTYEDYTIKYQESKIDLTQFSDIETRYKNLKIQLDTASETLKIFNEKTSKELVNIAQSQLEQAQASLNAASNQFENSVIKAPFAGVISRSDIKKGSMVSSASPSIVLMGNDMHIECVMSENVVSKLKNDQIVQIKFSSNGEKVNTGKIYSISPSSDRITSLFTVKIKLDDQNVPVKAGMIAKVTFGIDKKQNIIAIPDKTIIIEDDVKYVFVVDANNIAQKRTVITGVTSGGTVEITEGLKFGERIISEGQFFVNNGEAVNISDKTILTK